MRPWMQCRFEAAWFAEGDERRPDDVVHPDHYERRQLQLERRCARLPFATVARYGLLPALPLTIIRSK